MLHGSSPFRVDMSEQVGGAVIVSARTFLDGRGGEFGDQGSPSGALGFADVAPHRGVSEVEVLVAFAGNERVRGLVSQRGQSEKLLERGVAGAGLPFVDCRLLRPTCNVDLGAVQLGGVECAGDPVRGQRAGDPLFVGQVMGGSALHRDGSPLGSFPQTRCCTVPGCTESGGCRHGVLIGHSVCGFPSARPASSLTAWPAGVRNTSSPRSVRTVMRASRGVQSGRI